jgi:hypothetical protein
MPVTNRSMRVAPACTQMGRSETSNIIPHNIKIPIDAVPARNVYFMGNFLITVKKKITEITR